MDDKRHTLGSTFLSNWLKFTKPHKSEENFKHETSTKKYIVIRTENDPHINPVMLWTSQTAADEIHTSVSPRLAETVGSPASLELEWSLTLHLTQTR